MLLRPPLPADLIVSPCCRGALVEGAGTLECSLCGSAYPQRPGGAVDLLPPEPVDGVWQGRQAEMEAWYRDLADRPSEATDCLEQGYEPFTSLLAGLSGTVLDLGGGRGVTRHYLAEGVRYVVLDPSLDWLGTEWEAVDVRLSGAVEAPTFVRGVGERLPFRDGAFDAVLAFWSLNHVRDPAAVLSEVRRVLRPGGRFLAVLEDMEPRWSDFLGRGFWRRAVPGIGWGLIERYPPRLRHWVRRVVPRSWRYGAAVLAAKAACALPGIAWPTQPDHLRLTEREVIAWGKGLRPIGRGWTENYLTYLFERGA